MRLPRDSREWTCAPRMIPRYSRPEMARLWEPRPSFASGSRSRPMRPKAWPSSGSSRRRRPQAVRKRGGFDVARIDAIEREVKHDVIAFLTSVAEHVGTGGALSASGHDLLGRARHLLQRAAGQGGGSAHRRCRRLARGAEGARVRVQIDTPTIGRSHGVHAEPTTFGLKLAYAYAEFARARARLVAAREEVATCAISGAVGTFAHVDPRVEAYVAEKLGPEARADLHPSDPARPPRAVFRDARRGGGLGGAARDRDPAFAADRGARGRGRFQRRPEGLLRHAA